MSVGTIPTIVSAMVSSVHLDDAPKNNCKKSKANIAIASAHAEVVAASQDYAYCKGRMADTKSALRLIGLISVLSEPA
jgi:hypothetical protein